MHTDFSTSLNSTQDEIRDKFTPKKNNSQYLSAIYAHIGEESRSRRVFHCADILEFALSENEHKLFHADFCKDRFCPMCQFRRSLKVFGQVSACMDELDKDMEGYVYLFLTLTIKNPSLDDLEQGFLDLKCAFNRLLHRKAFCDVVCGGFYSIEITCNSSRSEFHPHIHCILAVRKSYFHKSYISQAKWAQIWQKCLKVDYLPVVDVRRVKGAIFDGSRVDYSRVVAEIAKYSVKDKDFLILDDIALSERVLSKLVSTLNYKKMCGFFGCFADVRKRLQLDDIENGDLVNTDNNAIRIDVATLVVTYRWTGGMYSVARTGSNSALVVTSAAEPAGRRAKSPFLTQVQSVGAPDTR